MARHAWHGPRRNAGLGIFVAQVRLAVDFGSTGDKLAAVDGYFAEKDLRVNRLVAFADQEVGDNDDRALVAVGNVEGLDHGGKAIGNAQGCENHPREVTLAGADDLIEVSLL